MSCSEFQLSKKTDVPSVGRLIKGIKLSNHQAEKNTRLVVILRIIKKKKNGVVK
jgi:hypothetical protein